MTLNRYGSLKFAPEWSLEISTIANRAPRSNARWNRCPGSYKNVVRSSFVVKEPLVREVDVFADCITYLERDFPLAVNTVGIPQCFNPSLRSRWAFIVLLGKFKDVFISHGLLPIPPIGWNIQCMPKLLETNPAGPSSREITAVPVTLRVASNRALNMSLQRPDPDRQGSSKVAGSSLP